MSKLYFRLGQDDQPDFGAHLMSRRTGYTHHGIFVGDGKVIHYAGLSGKIETGLIEETTTEAFRGGKVLWVRVHPKAKFSSYDVVIRARSRLGEDRYCVVSNNCQHFVRWCIFDEHESAQVDRGFGGSVLGIGAGMLAVSRVALGSVGVVGGLSGPGIMSGLKALSFGIGGAVGGLVNAPLAAGTGVSLLLNNTVLKKQAGLTDKELNARKAGRWASHGASVVATAGGVGAVYVSGASLGLSAVGISSGLASVGAVVGGGMAAGSIVIMATPAVAALALGYGTYKLVQLLGSSETEQVKRLALPAPENVSLS